MADSRYWLGTLEIGEFSARWRGAVGDSVPHSHFAAQAVIAVPCVGVEHEGSVVEARAVLIEPNVVHRLRPCVMADLYFVEPTRRARLPELVASISSGPYRLVSQIAGRRFWEGWLANEDIPPLDHRLLNAVQLIDGELEAGHVRLTKLASAAGLSPDRFRHLFSAQYGIPLRRYMLWRRMRLAAQRVAAGDNITQAAHCSGFSDSAHFARTIKQMFGVNASQLGDLSQSG